MRLNCVITDDEPFAVKGLVKYVQDIDFLNLVGTCENAMELNSLLQRVKIDLVFLDIQMPHITGLEFIKSLKSPPLVIFTTAYDKYAIESFELDVVDYLLKPIPFSRFLKAATKAFQYFQLLHQQNKPADYFFIKCNYRLEKILLNEILYVESMQNYVHVITPRGKFTTHLTLKALKEQLNESSFIQTHQSYIIAIDKIEAIEGNQVIIDKYKIPISKYLREQVLESIVNRNLLMRKKNEID